MGEENRTILEEDPNDPKRCRASSYIVERMPPGNAMRTATSLAAERMWAMQGGRELYSMLWRRWEQCDKENSIMHRRGSEKNARRHSSIVCWSSEEAQSSILRRGGDESNARLRRAIKESCSYFACAPRLFSFALRPLRLLGFVELVVGRSRSRKIHQRLRGLLPIQT